MARQVLIIHGWSDSSDSFHALAEFLGKNGYQPKVLWLGDYISMKDDVRVLDVARRMGEVVDERIASGALARTFDVVVHSTGGLVARAWLTSRYRNQAEACPMKRLIMLAPANYGSRLAATGKSLLGRVFKGYNNWFETGRAMLNDLELSSPFQWELAERDIVRRPGADATTYYGPEQVWPFVIVGTHPYASLLRQIVNEDGSDGTVRVCAANLNARGVTLDFSRKGPEVMTQWESRLQCDVPLAVLPTRTHSSIVDPLRRDKANREPIPETREEKAQLGERVLEALHCETFDDYRKIQEAWHELSERTARRAPLEKQRADHFHQYLQLNAKVVDDQGRFVPDYFLEFFSSDVGKHDDANAFLHGHVIEDVKTNSQNAALRSLYFDRTDLMERFYDKIPGSAARVVRMSISAAPPGENVSYFRDTTVGARQEIVVHRQAESGERWLRRNTTHFVEIIIPRVPAKDVFRLKRYA